MTIAANPALSTSTPTTAAEQDGLPTPQRYIAMVAILAAIVLVVLDSAIANLALPVIGRTLQVTPGASVWVVTGYQVAIVMFLLPAGAAGETLGYRRVFMAGVTVFTLASAACALAPSLPWLVAARFVQGIGSAGVMALAVALLRFVYPKRLLGAAIGWNALVVALSGAAGPSLGAAILAVASWPWLFAVNIPVGLVVLAAGSRLPPLRSAGRRLDVVSIALNAASFGCVFFAVDRIVATPLVGIGLLAVALVALAALVHRERRRSSPLIPLDLLRERAFLLSVVASVCCFTAQMGSLVALPFYLQHELGQSAFQAGLYLTPWPLAVMLAAPLSGRLADRVATAWPCVIGGTCLAVALLLAAFWPLHGEPLLLVPIMLLAGFGFGLFQTPNNRSMLMSAPRERSGAAGGMQGMARLSGQTSGSVLMLVLFGLFPAETAPHAGLAIAAVFALASGLFSLLRTGARHQAAPGR